MRGLRTAAVAALLLPVAAQASESGDQLAQRLYDGTLGEARDTVLRQCGERHSDACFAAGLLSLVDGVEAAAQAFHRHGAATPGMPIAARLLGVGPDDTPGGPANPDPKPLSYEQLYAILADFVTALDTACGHFENAGAAGDYVISIDPLRVRIDLDGNGTADAHETLGALLVSVGYFADIPFADAPSQAVADTSIGFDRADALWFAGYTQIVAAPIDLLLAHDFSGLFNAYLHRIFPKAGLPMQDFAVGGSLFMDAQSDGDIADLIAAIHTLDFSVTDSARLAGVLERLKAITGFSRRNWEAILAETDDNRELVPSPRQTSIVPDMAVTQEIVDAWLATLDTLDQVFAGELLVPHWRFKQGFDLKAYFETATETDLVLLLTGSGALPFLRDGPVADAQSFAAANRSFGADWLNYAFWFN
ncbi:hypothetical protein [Devosia sp. A449]